MSLYYCKTKSYLINYKNHLTKAILVLGSIISFFFLISSSLTFLLPIVSIKPILTLLPDPVLVSTSLYMLVYLLTLIQLFILVPMSRYAKVFILVLVPASTTILISILLSIPVFILILLTKSRSAYVIIY